MGVVKSSGKTAFDVGALVSVDRAQSDEEHGARRNG
jgi:hypothetical protein